jgi:diguanylate cyclase (GGDEF)-like protein
VHPDKAGPNVWAYRISRLVAVGLALMLLGLIGLGLYGVVRIRTVAETAAKASAVAGAYVAAGDAISREVVGDEAVAEAMAGPDKHPSHDGLTNSLWAADGLSTPEDRAVADRVRRLHFAYHGAYSELAKAAKAGDRDRADAIARNEATPLLRQLDEALSGARDTYEQVEKQEMDTLRQTVSMVFLTALLAMPVGIGLVAALTLMITRYQRSLVRHASESARQALHDSLTGLPNRALFADRLDHALASGRREGADLAVMTLDLDRFKEVNDALGHGYGDELLRQMAVRLRSCLREGDTVARLSGDEFAVLLPGADAALATELGERLLGGLHRSFVLHDVTVDVEASIGVALAPAHGDTVEAIMRSADVAMYAAKDAKTGIVVYEPSLHVHQPNRLVLLGDLRRALDEPDQLQLHYQPKVGLDGNEVCGVEALVRWHHPTRGLVLPAEFIPVAETTGLINRLTEHVLRLAVAQGRAWLDRGLTLPLAVNLSPRCLLDTTLLERVRALLAEYGLPAELLRLEVTETAVMANPALAMSTLTGLHQLGIRLSIDDYGTGYSSMAYLRRLPVDELKVDRSFVLNMTENDNDAILVRSAIDLGHNLGLSVVAEGVEGADHVAALQGLGCDVAQGYHYARPMPAEDVCAWIEARPRPAPTPSLSATG